MKRVLTKSCIIGLAILMLPTLAFAGSATISWNSNTDDDLSGYRVYYGTTKGGPYGSSTAVVPKPQTSCTISDLSSGTYYFVVVALDTANNESPWSAEVSKIIAPILASSAPTTTPTSTTTTSSAATIPSTTPVVTPLTSTTSTTSPVSSTAAVGSTTSAPSSATSTSATAAPSYATLPAYGTYGQISGNAIQLNQVSFSFPARTKKAKLTYQAYDINSSSEVSILINGSTIAYVKKTKSSKWGGNKTITIPKAYLSSSSTNIVTFKTNSGSPATDRWGVRNIKIK